jgi:hypothetical protein
MSTEITAKLQELPHLPKPKLLALWRELFAKPAHPRLRRNLMVPILAYRLQEQAYGGLKPSTRKRLQKLAAELEQYRRASLAPVPQLRAGTRLLRQWQGQMHEVVVVDEGFDYRSKRYESLSEIARQITGTRWSGPLFFGLKQGRKARSTQRRPVLGPGCAALSTLASLQRKDWSSRSTPSRHSAKPARPISPANAMKDGRPSPRSTMTAASPVAT